MKGRFLEMTALEQNLILLTPIIILIPRKERLHPPRPLIIMRENLASCLKLIATWVS